MRQFLLPLLASVPLAASAQDGGQLFATYCAACHADAHTGWLSSAHRFSSFNNPVYAASVKDTRKVDAVYEYLRKYPNGFISEQAQLRVENLQKAQTVVVANRDGIVPQAAAARRCSAASPSNSRL